MTIPIIFYYSIDQNKVILGFLEEKSTVASEGTSNDVVSFMTLGGIMP